MSTFRFRPLHTIAFLICFLGLTNCSISQQTSTPISNPIITSAPYVLPYNVQQAAAELELPEKLLEISGLSLSKDQKHLVVVQDEDGIVFLLDKTSGEIVQEIEFGKPGDYEGIEQVGDRIYVVKSSSKIYEIVKPGEKIQEIFSHKKSLSKEFDIEGLAYDPTHNALLLACKAQPDALEEEANFAKAIYHFHLNTMTLDSVPAVVIDRQDIIDYFQDHPLLVKIDKDGTKKQTVPEKVPCYPSAIAIHPISGNYYISSSKGKVLFVVSPQGKILHIEKLQKKIHPQPEGLTFDKDGTLYISNEGKDGRSAKIYRFDYQMIKNQ